MNYSIVGLFALVIHLILNFEITFNWKKYKRVPGVRLFRIISLVLALFFITDILWGLFYEQGWVLATWIDTFVFFILIGLIVIGWVMYVINYLRENRLFFEILAILSVIFFFGMVVALIINIFVPILYYFDNLGQYQVTIGRYIVYGYQGLLFLLISIRVFISSIFSKSGNKGKYHAVALFGLFMLAGIVLQFILVLWPVYTICSVLGLCLVNRYVIQDDIDRIEKELEKSVSEQKVQQQQISDVTTLAYTDQLTGVKNKHAYVENEELIDQSIANGTMEDFSVVVFDLNDLKLINDKFGHDYGDKYIQDSVSLIKKYFPNNIIYRFGGDEFVTVLQNDVFKERYRILNEFNHEIEENVSKENAPVISTGSSDYIKSKDNTFRAVFSRADTNMYSRKRYLKKLQHRSSNGDDKEIETVSNSDFRTDFYELLTKNGQHSLIDFLNNSSCDEIIEINLNNDTFKQFYHVEGKYFVPSIEVSYDELYDYVVKHVVHPDDRDIYIRLMQKDGLFDRLLSSKIPNFDFAQFRYKLQDGSYRYVEQCIITGEENGIAPGTLRLYVFDVHNTFVRKLGTTSREARLISGDKNTLTGLLNEKFFLTKADEYLQEKKDINWCLIAIDIEKFNYFNQWFGREKGDELLRDIGKYLHAYESTHTAVAGYFGQDDFTLLIKKDDEEINKLYEALKQIIYDAASSFGFLPVFGIALLEEGMTAVDALDRATMAVRKARGNINSRIHLYDKDIHSIAEKEYRLLNILRDAFHNDEFDFYLQPQCRVTSGRIVGAEALARLIKKDGTLVPPGEFIPVLEKYGFITELDKKIWEKVCKYIAEQFTLGHDIVPISVNISRIDVLSLDILGTFKELTAKYGVPKKFLKLEITESAYIETTSIIEDLVLNLRKEGFQILMDDFGSGYSSLNMLSNMKVDALKLDARFLHLSGTEYEKGAHILESVVNMAKLIGLPIIVEGVETSDQKSFVEEMGCRYVQGYFFYKPMPRADFEKLMEKKELVDLNGFVVKLNEQFRIREFLDKNIYSDSMLNSIIGAVAIYSWHDKTHVDIVRFNQQFYESVNVPDFHERLLNIEQFLPEEDRPKIINALKNAKTNKLSGSNEVLRFYKTDGYLTSYLIHFFYLGKKEGGERFYGSASNITNLVDLNEERELLSRYANDNIIFIRKREGKWHYTVAANSLSAIFGLTPKELEEEMNSGKFANRISSKKDLKAFMVEAEQNVKENKDFVKFFKFKDRNGKYRNLKISFISVQKQTNNIEYVMMTTLLEDEIN